MWLTIKIVVKYLVAHPPRLLKEWIKNFLKDLSRNPILYFIFIAPFVLALIYGSYLIFIHKNADFIKVAKGVVMLEEINLALNSCGNGATVGAISIGEEYITDDKISFTFEYMRSCDKNLLESRTDGKCDLDVKWLNPEWQKIHEIDNSTLRVLNSDFISFGGLNMVFKDGQPIWIPFRNDDGTLTKEARAIEIITPKLFDMLNDKTRGSKRAVNDIGIVKLNHPNYKHIVYLFTLSFWNSSFGLPEMLCEKNKTQILRRLYKVKKQQLR